MNEDKTFSAHLVGQFEVFTARGVVIPEVMVGLELWAISTPKSAIFAIHPDVARQMGQALIEKADQAEATQAEDE